MSFCPENGYLYSLEWSPTRPCVFACATHNGNILLYDLMELGTSNACQVIQASADCPIYTLNFNKQRNGYLASGDRSGQIKIWKLSQNYTKIDAGELRVLNEISEKSFEEEKN